VAIVTGACGAIGQAIAHKLTQNGYRLALADLASDRLQALAQLYPMAIAVPVDMADTASIQALVDTTHQTWGRIDHVVNNAAVNHRGSLADFDPDKWDHMMAVNLRGPAVLCQKVIPHWARQMGGSVVNVASRSWVAGGPPAYVACKAGLVGLTRSMARELAPYNVRSNAVAPGLIRSAFTTDGRSDAFFDQMADRAIHHTPLGRLTQPEDVANTVAFLTSPDAAYISAEVVHVCGGSQLAPLGGANQ
jgi:NAD(P)-dependent dehydrogenase (short-subunit alcohol dehydrogenase family)